MDDCPRQNPAYRSATGEPRASGALPRRMVSMTLSSPDWDLPVHTATSEAASTIVPTAKAGHAIEKDLEDALPPRSWPHCRGARPAGTDRVRVPCRLSASWIPPTPLAATGVPTW